MSWDAGHFKYTDYNKENAPLDIPRVVQDRMKEVTKEVFNGMDQLQIPDPIYSKVAINFNLDDIKPNVEVKEIKDQVIVEIPLLFLIKEEDFKPESPVYSWLSSRFNNKILTQKELRYLEAFKHFILSPLKAEQAKQFVIYHELAHIYFNDMNKKFEEKELSHDMEFIADSFSAQMLGTTEGGVYLFQLMSLFVQGESKTHPSFVERIAHLKKLKL